MLAIMKKCLPAFSLRGDAGAYAQRAQGDIRAPKSVTEAQDYPCRSNTPS
jgi:hypothetical protein